MNIVLHQPEIPSNTGNIGRTCVATGTAPHLIEPIKFQLNEKQVKRAGMDYWDKLLLYRYINFADFLSKHEELRGERGEEKTTAPRLWLATTKAKRAYTEVSYGMGDFIMFGRESGGIPEEILIANESACIRIPMLSEIRSLNLANSVAIVLYEALRQNGFPQMEREGRLHGTSCEVRKTLQIFQKGL